MQPNGTPRVLALHPISSTTHEGASVTASKQTLIQEHIRLQHEIGPCLPSG